MYSSTYGDLIVHDHVDDSRLTSTTTEAREHFYRYWAAEFGEPLESAELSEDFTGLRHHVCPDGSVQISCVGVIRSLAMLVKAHPLAPGTHVDTPMAADTLLKLRAGQDKDTLIPALLEEAQKLAGTIGFVVSAVRPDANFAYVALASYINVKRLTRRVFMALVRVALYLLGTETLTLTLRQEAPGKSEPMRAFSR